MKPKSIKKPYMTNELFDKVIKIVLEKTESSLSIESCSAYHKTYPLKNYEFDVVTEITRGGNEGTYLCVYICGDITEIEDSNKLYIGHIKTLDTDLNAYKQLGILAGEICYYGDKFVEDNIDDFTWRGYRIESKRGTYEVLSPERAIKRLSEDESAKAFDLSKWDNPAIPEMTLRMLEKSKKRG